MEDSSNFERLGIVEFDIAEYARRRKSSRTFELSQSRINARLKVLVSFTLVWDRFLSVFLGDCESGATHWRSVFQSVCLRVLMLHICHSVCPVEAIGDKLLCT